MNFTRLSTLILVLFTTHFASAESLCHQPYQGEPNLLVKDQVRFPGHGKICADQVCVTSDLKTLQTTLPARTEKSA